jgi:hypothetical protein
MCWPRDDLVLSASKLYISERPTYKSTDIKSWYSNITTFLYQKWSTLRDFFSYFSRPMSSSAISTSKLRSAVNMADFISGSEYCALLGYRGADKSLAYQEENKLQRPNSSFCKQARRKKKFVRPTRSPRQQWPPRRTKNGDLSIVFSAGSG